MAWPLETHLNNTECVCACTCVCSGQCAPLSVHTHVSRLGINLLRLLLIPMSARLFAKAEGRTRNQIYDKAGFSSLEAPSSSGRSDTWGENCGLRSDKEARTVVTNDWMSKMFHCKMKSIHFKVCKGPLWKHRGRFERNLTCVLVNLEKQICDEKLFGMLPPCWRLIKSIRYVIERCQNSLFIAGKRINI